MARSLLLDLCAEQDRILDAHLAAPPEDPRERWEWTAESVVALAAHIDVLVRALRTVPHPEVAGLMAKLVQTVRSATDRLTPYASPAQLAELDQLRRSLAEAMTVGGPSRAEAIDMVRAGQALELDEAFAALAGLTPDAWAARVAARRPPQGGV